MRWWMLIELIVVIISWYSFSFQIIMLHTLNLQSTLYQLYINKT